MNVFSTLVKRPDHENLGVTLMTGFNDPATGFGQASTPLNTATIGVMRQTQFNPG